MSPNFLNSPKIGGDRGLKRDIGKQASCSTALTVDCLGTKIKVGKTDLPMPAKKGSSPGEKKKGPSHLQKCPACGEITLFWDKCTNQGVCINSKCKLSGR
jgi:hypothetical protein